MRALREIGEVQVGLSEKTCVYAEDKIQLYRYVPLARSARVPPLLICYAMVNRPYMLDLQPDRSLIRELLSLGIDVYLLDWGYPDGADRFIPLTEYVSDAALNSSSSKTQSTRSISSACVRAGL